MPYIYKCTRYIIGIFSYFKSKPQFSWSRDPPPFSQLELGPRAVGCHLSGRARLKKHAGKSAIYHLVMTNIAMENHHAING